MKIKQVKKIGSLLFAFVALIAYSVSLRNETELVSQEGNEKEYIEILLMNEFNENVPFTIEVEANLDMTTLCNFIVEKMQLNANLKDGFTGIFPVGLKVNVAKVEVGILYIDFNDNLNEINPSFELKIIEAMSYVFTQFDDVHSFKFTVNNQEVTKLNKGQIQINQPIQKGLILNNFSSVDAMLHRSNGFLVAFKRKVNYDTYITYQMIRSNDSIVDCIENYYTNSDSIFLNQEIIFKQFEINQEDRTLVVDCSSEILTPQKTCNPQYSESILFTLNANFDVDKILLVVEGLTVCEVDTDTLRINEIVF